MRKLILIILLLSNLSFSFAQIQIIRYSSEGEYFITYYKDMVLKNKVSSFKISYCNNCNDSNKKKHTILNYEKFFNVNGDEYKIINYKKNGKTYLVDSFVYNNENFCEVMYESKNGKPFKPIIKYFELEEEKKILDNKESTQILIKNNFNQLVFSNKDGNKSHKYILTKNRIEPLNLYDYDNYYYFQKIIHFDTEFMTSDTITYKSDYENLNGKSIRIRNNITYLNSVMLFNNDNRIIKENFFDIPLNTLNVKNIKDIQPYETIIYHYIENGLFDYIEFFNYTGSKGIMSFQYKYYDK